MSFRRDSDTQSRLGIPFRECCAPREWYARDKHGCLLVVRLRGMASDGMQARLPRGVAAE